MLRTPEKRLQKVGEGGGLTEKHGGNSGEGAAMPLALHRLPHANSTRTAHCITPQRLQCPGPGTEEDGGSKGTEGGHMKV